MSSGEYVTGDHWVICDRTGTKVRASQTRLEWNGLRVRKDAWEPRHPQDLVRGRTDRQAVLDGRPRTVDTFIGPLVTSVVGGFAFSSGFSSGFNQTDEAGAGSTRVRVASAVGWAVGNNISIMLDNDDTHRATITSVPDSKTIHFTPALTGAASAGNRVFNNSLVTEPTLG